MNIKLLFAIVLPALFVTGCVSPDYARSEPQIRMQRCEQYVGDAKERCLNGMVNTIEEYKDDLKEYEEQIKEQEIIPLPNNANQSKP